jgi:hypothetical protein
MCRFKEAKSNPSTIAADIHYTFSIGRTQIKAKAVPLHAMKAFGGEEL